MRQLIRQTDRVVVASDLRVADTFLGRLRGLMFRRGLEPGEGLLLDPCDGVHMLFMTFRIDVLFLDVTNAILKVSQNVRPWLGLAWCFGASKTVELAAGRASEIGLAPGDVLCLEEIP